MSNAARINGNPAWAKHLIRTCLMAGLFGCLVSPTLLAQVRKDDPAEKTPKASESPQKSAAPFGVTPAQIRVAVTKAIPPLEKSLVVYAEKRDCYSCHNQGVPLVALNIVRSRGIAIDDDAFQGAVALTLADLESAREDYAQGRGQPGGATRAGYALWTLEVGSTRPTTSPPRSLSSCSNLIAAAITGRPRPGACRWRRATLPRRRSRFGGCVALAPKEQSEVLNNRVKEARSWLAKTTPADTEDRVFRLWGFKYAGGPADEIKAAASELLATQCGDGGWAQLSGHASDAYATGSALVALHEASGLATADPAYRRGLAFLVHSQRDDGTWFVASRSKPFQPYFESGFPYGKDQFIAVAASGWATAALALALPASAPDR